MILNTFEKGGITFLDEVTVKVKDGDILGYFTVEELSKQSGATEGNIRQMVHRGQLHTITGLRRWQRSTKKSFAIRRQ